MFLLFFQPTFTQGLIIGQLSILILLGMILKYLFLESSQYPLETASYHQVDNDAFLRKRDLEVPNINLDQDSDASESTKWFNALLSQVVDVYRSKLRDDIAGMEGDEVARKRIEVFANTIRPAGFVDHIAIHSVNLGTSAPSLFNARVRKDQPDLQEIEFDANYIDTLSLSLSTSYLFNYPTSSFAKLPISLTISLSQFKSSISVRPPSATDSTPVLTLTISPNFVLDLITTSLMGSRAKLANVPKLHELIQHQLRRVLAARATWKVALPGLSGLPEENKKAKQP